MRLVPCFTRLRSSTLFALVLSMSFTRPLAQAEAPGLYADFTTPRGTVVTELFFEKAPLTVANFVGLAEGKLGPEPRKPYFDGLTFHRVVADFVVQGGDPTGTGGGGPGYEFQDEFRPGLGHDAPGILSMANAGPDTNGSQFFFTLRAVRRLDFLHSVFGRVIAGLELLPTIVQGDTMTVKIRRIGAAAETFRVDQARFDELIAATPRVRPAHFDDPDLLLPQSPPRARGFVAKLANVERFTGLRLYVRLFGKPSPSDSAKETGEIAREFAQAFGAPTNGFAALYFADRDEWAVWIGDALLTRFNPDGAPLPEAKSAFIASARGRASALVADLSKMTPDQPLTAQQKLKLLTDEVIDGAIERLVTPLAAASGIAAPHSPTP